MNTTQTATLSPADTISTSRGFGRAAARSTVGSGPSVLHRALTKARAQFGAIDSNEFVSGWHDERRAMRA